MDLPLRFGDVEAEWRAARERCAVFEASFRAVTRVTGGDRESFLQGMLSNDVKALVAGQGRYAAHLTQQGKVVCDLRVYKAEQHFLLDTLASRAEALGEALGRHLIADDVELQRDARDAPLVGVEGPGAARVLGQVLGATTPEEPLSHREVELDGRRLRVVAVSELNRSGFLLCGEPTLAPQLFEALCDAGATPLGMTALNVLRVESGVPWYGLDIDAEVLVMELGMERALSFTKGCYLGQEVVERIVARGHVNRSLAGLLLDGPKLPAAGARLFSANRDVGCVTSAVHSIALNRQIALGYVHRSCLEPGTELKLSDTTGGTKVTVTPLPFVP